MIIRHVETKDRIEYVCRPDRVRWGVMFDRMFRSFYMILIFGFFANFTGTLLIGMVMISMPDKVIVTILTGPVFLAIFVGSLIPLQRILRQWLWYFFGREKIIITSWTLQLIRTNIFPRRTIIQMQDVFSIGFRPIDDQWFATQSFGINRVRQGDIILKTRGGNIRFGCNLDDNDNLKIAEKINEHIPTARSLREIWSR